MPQKLVSALQPKIDAAFRIASRKAIERAREAGHGIVIWRNGRVVEISCDEAEAMLARAEADAKSSQPDRAAIH
jgi:hypothetical protein